MDQGQPANGVAALASSTDSFEAALLADARQWLDLGGPIVWILMFMALIATAIVLIKLWHFRGLGGRALRETEEALNAWGTGRRDAVRRLNGVDHPVARAVRVAMTGISRSHPVETVREETTRVANAELVGLRSYLRPLELIATLSPLLGLLGTVVGMIEAFQALQASGSQVDPGVLSGGIWQALMTTAVGLAVAIPVTVVHGWLDSTVERLAHAIEDAATRVFTGGMGAQTVASADIDDAGFIIPDAA
ncbi:MAG: MotA/TolQ/ExbB proton channel family protein [Burkholderiaceae bacterium]